MAHKIVVFGSFVADLTGRAQRLPVPGETVLGNFFKSGPGGKGSNQAVAAHRAGGNVTFVTKLGVDAFGDMARDFYAKEGMDTSALLKDTENPTGIALILVNENTAENMIMVVLGACEHITPEDVASREALIAQADILLLQMEINTDALYSVIRIAKKYGTRVILNPAPAQPVPDEILAMIDTVTPNETEACTLTGVKVENAQDAHKAAKVFLEKGVKNVVITLGKAGSFVTDGTREEMIPSFPVKAIDTTGAGDAFNGTFAKALADGKDIFTAARFGNAAGALCVTKFGTAPAMPFEKDIQGIL